MWLFILYIIAEKSVIMNEVFLVDVSIHYYPYAFFKKQAMGILLSPPSARPSVRPSVMLSLLKPLGQIWRERYSHEWGVQQGNLFCPASWGPGERSKGHISFNFNYKVNLKDFLYKNLCVFSKIKDTKHIRRNFYSVTWVMP